MSTMLTSPLLGTDWLRALSLRERRTVLERGISEVGASVPHAPGTVRRWRTELSLTEDSDYDEWLEDNRWDDAMLRDVLRLPLPADTCGHLDRPLWLSILEDAFGPDAPPENGASPLAGVRLEAHTRTFLMLVEPLVRRAIERLRHSLAHGQTGLALDGTRAHELFLPALAENLASRVGRTLTLELHVARMREQLTGDTPEERFQSFATLLRDRDYVRALLREYPVLARQLAECAAQWVDFTVEFLTHLHNDWAEIKTAFAGGADPGTLVAVASGAGDAHRSGRSVQVVSFESGLRLVYKPRALDVDAHFHEIVAWMNRRGFEPVLRVPTILRRPGYGWSEFIAPAECGSTAEVERFYHRMGGLLALLYAIEATDFHMENLIAAGEHPVLVDLEALFHHRPANQRVGTGSRALAYEQMKHSVLRVGLLPERGDGNTPMAKLDVSGLGGPDGQLSPFPVFQLEGAGTDRMRIVRRHVKLAAGQNRPRLNGDGVNAYEHAETIVEGFSRAHALIRRYRHELTGSGGLLDRFADDEIRVVLRATRVYGRVLMEASHPSVLGDSSELECLLYRLGRAAAHRPYLKPILQDEIADLLDGSIPMFASQPGSRDLWTSRGVRIPDFFEQTSLENVRQRIGRLDDADLKRQIWFIRASLATTSLLSHEGANQGVNVRRDMRSPNGRRAGGPELIQVAASIGDRLDEMAFREGGLTSWVGIELRGEEHWTLQPVGPDLYGGTAGIALFLGYLGQVTAERRHTDLALALAEEAKQDLADEAAEPGFARVGPFAGWSGWMYTLAHLARISGDRALLATAHRIRKRIVRDIDGDDDLDVIGGAAGLIGALAALHSCDPSPDIVQDVQRCADHLTARVTPVHGGLAWKTDMPSKAPLTGFSHGASGMAWALLRAAALTGDDRSVDVARAAIDYERAVYLPEIGNWPDFREPADGAAVTTWCHGAPGIGLARLHALGRLDHAVVREDLERAIRTTMKEGFGRSHCICHGDLGNVQLLHEAGRVLGRDDLAEKAAKIAGRVAAAIREWGPICGTPAGIEVPGLMCGIAGIGLALLRLAEPDRVPSVLTLDPPLMRDRPTSSPPGEPGARRRSVAIPADRRKETTPRR